MEFKATTGQRTEAARTLSAMLNGEGGMVVFGVQPNGSVAGQQVSERTLEDITQACREIHPAYPPSIERVPIPGRAGAEVLLARVPGGNAKPYQHKGGYYVRSGAATVAMPAETELALVLERAHAFDRWELATSGRGMDGIDTDEVLTFRDEAIATNRGPFEPTAGSVEVLRALHLLDENGDPNRAAVVLFAHRDAIGADYAMLGAHLVAVDGVDLGERFRAEALLERNAFVSLREAARFCLDQLDRTVQLEGIQASAAVEIPVLVLREALANAFAHRDYAIAGRVQVRIFTDRVEVLSPGALHFGLAPADLYLPHGSHPWNPLIVAGLYRRGLVDQLGSGTLRMIRLCAQNGTGRPVFSSTPTSVTCAIPRRGYWLRPDGVSVVVREDEVAALRTLAEGPIARADLARRLSLDDPATRAVLERLREHDLAHTSGHGRAARWHLAPPQTPPD